MRATAADQTLFAVPLDNGTTWTGTERELRRDHPDWIPYAQVVQPRRQATRATEDDPDAVDIYDDKPPGWMPTSTRTYAPVPGRKQVEYEYQDEVVHTTIPPRRSAQRKPNPNRNRAQPPDVIEAPSARQRDTDDVPKRHRRGFFAHPLLYLGIGMIVMLALWVGLQALGSWWQRHQDDVNYGYPRTWQTDSVVGHNADTSANPSHFIFLNLNGHIEVIEIPAGDPTKMKVYIGPTLFSDNADLIPVTGEFRDLNGDGKPDMIIHIQNSRIVFLNTGDGFRPLKQGEHITL